MANLPSGMRHVAPLHHDEPLHRHHVFRKYHEPDEHDRILGKVHRGDLLNPIESAYLLQYQNKTHAARLAEFQGPLPKKIQTLMIICADARMGGMFDFDDFARRGIAAIYVAGNVSDILSTPGIKEVFKRMDKDSSVVIMGHAKCGAVHCAQQHSETGLYADLRNIAVLLRLVKPTGEMDNLRAQRESLSDNPAFKKLAAKKNIRVIKAFVDIAHEKPHIHLVHSNQVLPQDTYLMASLNRRFQEPNAGQDLSTHQFAPAGVISGPSLPFDAREIFDAKANEIFCVSGGDFGGQKHKGRLSQRELASVEMAALGLLDEQSVGSIEYSVTKNKSQHILLLHTDLAVVDAWEADLLKKSEIVTDALLAGKLEITTAVYDQSTGLITMVRHLVNENAATAIMTQI